uniref:Putative metalloprotease n=1 Tax=Pithovirus LCPAC406 TaxID=2506599 RepID=A0A481ZFZ1_9VIRU|nr:MAG: putative metalloprotease [Pithovirus LCPAC406]
MVISDCSTDVILPQKECGDDDCCDKPTKTQVIKVKNSGNCPVFVKPARGNNIHSDCDEDKIVLRCGENTELANCSTTWYVISGRD